MASGRPDWFGTIVAAGKYDTTFIPIGLDETGAILALMKGAYDSVLKTIAVDDAGVMKANLSAQDLDFLTVRPAYGQMRGEGNSETVPSGVVTSIKRIEGRGISLGGFVRWTEATNESIILLNVDDIPVVQYSALQLHNFSAYERERFPLYLSIYDTYYQEYIVHPTWGITFEESFEIKVYHTTGGNEVYMWSLFWALAP